jgi:hypothetical protein
VSVSIKEEGTEKIFRGIASFNLLRATLGVLLLLVTLGSLSCSSGDPSSPQPPASQLRGVGLSPSGFPLDYSLLNTFFAEVGGLGHSDVMWNGAWRDDAAGGSDAGTIPAAAVAVAQAGQANDFTPVAVFGWRSGSTLYISIPTNTVNNWSNADARGLYASTVAAYASAYHPQFLFLGNENDFYYAQDPADYANWIVAYNAAYDAVKTASPSTLVGPVFSFEHTAGSGKLNSWDTPYWGAVDAHDFSRVDIIGLTLYPWLNYADPSKVPATYLDPLFSHIANKPVAITESGWPAENLGNLNPLWTTSDQAQVDYISILDSVIQGRDIRLVNWLFLYPMVDDGSSSLDWKLFGSVSLRDSTGAKRPAYDAWAAR